MNAEFSNADGTTTVTVSHDGLGSTGGWSVTIAGQELHGDDTDRSAAEAALWNVPDGGGIAAVEGCGAIRVPHRAAGRVASIALAGLAMVPGGDSAALAVGEGDDPLAA